MATENYISSSCLISGSRVYKDNQPVFADQPEDLSGFFLAAYRHLGVQYPKFHKMDNLSKLGWLAAEFLLAGDPLTNAYNPADIGVILANASSSLDTDLKYYATTKAMASPALFVYTLPNIVTGEICIRHGFKGENAFFVTEKFDAVSIRQYVDGLLNDNILQSAVCGWVELLGEQYKTVLFLIEKKKTGMGLPFTIEQINKTYLLENG